MKEFLRLLQFLKPYYGRVLLSVLLGAATIGSAIGLLGTSAYLIARAALHPSVAALEVAIVSVRFFGITRGLFRYLERLVSHSVNFRLLGQLRTWFFAALEPLAPARLQDIHGGDLLNRVTADIETLENFYVRAVAPPFTALIVTIGMAWFVGSFDPVLAGVLVCGLLLGGVAVPGLAHILSRQSSRTIIEQRAALRGRVIETLQGLADLVIYGRAADRLAEIRQSSDRMGSSQMGLAWIGGVSAGLNTLVTNLTLWALLLVAISLVRAGKLDGVALAVLSLVVLASFEAAAPLATAAQQLESSLLSARRLFDLVDALPAVDEPGLPEPAPSSGPAAPHLSIRGLSFQYSPETAPAIEGLNLDLGPGKHVALVGPSGAGKSTLFQLLLRFWEVPHGQVWLDGRDIREYAASDVRAMCGVVSQNTYLFSATLRQNLHLARPGAAEEELLAVLAKARLLEWMNKLPDGLDTWIGEQGVQMSGGERQRLAIAMALLRDARLWLLDEPTANLDSLSECALLQTLQAVTEGKSSLWSTHRLIGLESMDEIIVLDQGHVIERGREEVLLKKEGVYARMWRAQRHLI